MVTVSNRSDTDAPRSGTQSIERAVQVLRVLAERDRFGWGLLDLAARCGLSRGTMHRILAGLLRERMVTQRKDRRYALGPLVFEMGLAMGGYRDFGTAGQAAVDRLAQRFATLAILYLYSGNESVCAAHAGPSPYASGIEVGLRLPLVSTAGGVAILISLPPAQREAARAAGLAWVERIRPRGIKRLQQLIERSERLGYAFNQGDVTSGVNSFGVPVRRTDGEVLGSLVISGTAERFPSERVQEVVGAIRQEVAALERNAALLGRG